MGGLGDLFDRRLESLFVRRGRLGETADRPHELEGGVPDLAVGDGRREVEEELDRGGVTAPHDGQVDAGRSHPQAVDLDPAEPRRQQRAFQREPVTLGVGEPFTI